MAIEGRAGRAQGPIRYGMVGGGQGAFIGGVHRIAARMDGEFELVAGALSSEVSFWIEALAAAIFLICGCTESQTSLAQEFSLSFVSSSPPQPDSASTSTAPPDSAAASFLFTGLVPSMALGPGTYTPDGRHLCAEHPRCTLL